MTTAQASENNTVATRKHDNREVLWLRADTLTVALKTKSKRLPQWMFVPDTHTWRSQDWLLKDGHAGALT